MAQISRFPDFQYSALTDSLGPSGIKGRGPIWWNLPANRSQNRHSHIHLPTYLPATYLGVCSEFFIQATYPATQTFGIGRFILQEVLFTRTAMASSDVLGALLRGDGFAVSLLLGGVLIVLFWRLFVLRTDQQEPPVLKARIPVIGHTLGMLFDSHGYWKKL